VVISTSSFRMHAVIACWNILLRPTNRAENPPITGLYLRASNADMYRFNRTRGRPPRMYAVPCDFPLATGCGATPASDAIRFASKRPNRQLDRQEPGRQLSDLGDALQDGA
jgi:hypothetical protein